MRIRLALPILAAAAALAACSGSSKSAVTSSPGTTCVGCHGSGDNSAPPVSTTGATATTSVAVGAHQTHVTGMLAGSKQRFRKPVACSECHPVPMSSAKAGPHIDGAVEVVFGPLASAGRSVDCQTSPGDPACPVWGGPASPTCSAVYCHGSTLGGGLAGGSNTSPIWNRVDGSQVSCGTCHAIPPPPASGHPVVDATIPGFSASDAAASCATCHPGTVALDTTTGKYGIDLSTGQHIDGVVQIGAYACARCHGDVTRLPLALSPAPPTDVAGNTATTARGVGAHAVHLTGTRFTKAPMACAECHAVPTSMLAHPNPAYGPGNIVVDMTWGPLATAGGAVPSWNPTPTPSCSATYCHGGTMVGDNQNVPIAVPVWTLLDGSQVQCNSCHGMPPDTAGHAGMPRPSPATSCGTSACHPNTVDGGGTLLAAAGYHINGSVEVGTKTCFSCHGNAGKTIPGTATLAPVALQSAPPNALNGSSDTNLRGVGAHDAHLFGTALGPDGTPRPLRAAPIACTECHQQYVSTEHPSLPGHDPLNYDLVKWGPLATAGGSHPVWKAPFPRNSAPTAALNLSCATTYCHGATLSGGTQTSPVWTGGFTPTKSSLTCQSCHGNPPPLPHDQRSDCGTCHTGYTSSSVNLDLHMDGKVDATGGSCTSCHGDPSRTPSTAAAAPPLNAGTAGSPWASSDPGAHLKHVTGTKLRGAPVDCGECHTVPSGPPGPAGSGDTHGDGVATVVFGTLSKVGGASPAWSPATLTCSTTYCHGSTLAGGTETAPKWNETGGTASACGACHGVPPGDATHAPLAAGALCSSCHTGYGGAKGGALSTFTINPADHINGTVDAAGGSCTSCHGDSTRVLATGADSQAAAAPPVVANTGGPWTNDANGGAHLKHLNTGTLGKRVACSECHAVPVAAPQGGSDTHGNGVANVVFGTLSRTKTGPTAPSPTYVAPSCSTTYCHGNFTYVPPGSTTPNPNSHGKTYGVSDPGIAWSSPPTASGLKCGSCHVVNASDNPMPNDSCHPVTTANPNGFNHDGGNSCQSCHKNASGTANGTATITSITTHVDGTINGKCTDCHRTGNGAPWPCAN